MNEIKIGKRIFHTPSSWDELTSKQLLIWAEYCLLNKPNLESLYLRRIAFFEWDTVGKLFAARHTNRIQRLQIGWTVGFLSGDIHLSKILIPQVHAMNKIFHGPADQLKNLIVEEFAYADSHAATFLKTGKTDSLDKLIATLYRKKKPSPGETDDVREPFNPHGIEKRARIISKLKPEVKHAIFLQYAGNRAVLPKKFPAVFTQSNQSRAKNYGWPAVINDMAGSKLGPVDKVERMRLWNIFHIMQMNEERRVKAENITTQ
jgi:hypothetical protein